MSTSGFKFQPSSLPDDVVLSVRNVSKKFCRNLRRSMLYGIQDLTRSMLGMQSKSEFGNSGRSRESVSDLNPESGSETQVSGLSLHPFDGLRRDEFWAVRDINFDLKRGECLGLIGRNGSGKSTLLRLLTGIFPPNTGEIAVRGRVGALIALGAGFHPHMTGRENVYLNGAILGLSQRDIDQNLDEIIDFAEIGSFIDAPVSTYSSGMTVRLGFAVAAFQKPDLLLIDEVLAVGDTGFREKCMNHMVRFLDKSAIIFVSHQMPMVSRMCNRVLLMDKSRPLYLGTDVARGVEMYDDLFQCTPEARVAGSGRIKLVQPIRLFLVDSGGGLRETVELPCRAEMVVTARVRPDSSLVRFIPAVVICRKTGEYAAIAFGRDDDFVVETKGGEMLISARMQNLLTPGEYDLSLAFHEEMPGILATNVGETVGYFINAIRFRVPADRVISAAPVQFPCAWKVEELCPLEESQ